jgi:hypothetical protein
MNSLNPTYKTDVFTTAYKKSTSANVSEKKPAIRASVRKKTNEFMGIPLSVFRVIMEIEYNAKLTDEEIKQKFLETGYEYAENLANYHIDKRKNP